MKCIYHKQDDTYRVVNRGSLFYVQHNDGSQSNREHDPWVDMGLPKDTSEAALETMHVYKPLVQA